MRIIVASSNPVKIGSALEGFREMFPDESFEAEGAAIPSGVSAQPIGDDETYQGAFNRARGARDAIRDADFWVGIEGGNLWHGEEMETMAWVVVLSEDRIGKARTAGFFLSPQTIDLIRQGYELGHADEMIFGTSNSKQKMGSSGLLTDNVMTRTRFYIPAVILALIPFKKPDLFPLTEKKF